MSRSRDWSIAIATAGSLLAIVAYIWLVAVLTDVERQPLGQCRKLCADEIASFTPNLCVCENGMRLETP